MATDHQRDIIYLAALLHDIGKFYQRADSAGVKNSDFIADSVKGMEDQLCPAGRKGNYRTHKHVLWTYQFFEDFKQKFNSLFENSGVGGDRKRTEMARISSAHHNPQGIQETLIQKADHWSSGADRTKGVGWQDAEEEEYNLPRYKSTRLRSVLEAVKREVDDKSREKFQWQHRMPTQELNLGKTFFPKKEFPDVPDYKNLWENFIQEFEQLPEGNITAFQESLLSLLEKYTSTIPSSTQHLADVSLYDHLKTTAAMAVGFYDYFKEQNHLTQLDTDPYQEALMLVGGDVSGVQKFIYDIVAKNAAKNLKGRSFYLELMVSSVIRELLSDLNLYPSNVVYGSGGMFFILAPNTNQQNKDLEAFKSKISEKLFKTHGTALFLAMDKIGICQNDLFYEGENDQEHLSTKWRLLNEKLNEQKRKRHKDQLVHQFEDFFEPIEKGGTAERDVITQEEISGKKMPWEEGDENTKRYVAQTTYQQIKLGQQLKDAQKWVSSNSPIPQLEDINSTFSVNPLELKTHHYFLSDNSNGGSYPDDKGLTQSIFNPEGDRLIRQKTRNIGQTFTFYAGNKHPTNDNGSPKTFSELAGSEETSFKRLGVLRMDVDNLGQAFVNGFIPERRTFSRYSTLSRNLDYFFKGYLNQLWKSDQNFKDWTYIIYAGGDDLFVVGKWDVLLCLASDIRDAFTEWACENPNLSLSGGLVLVPPKFPVSKAASMAEDAEELAKNHSIKLESGNMKKNSFTLFDFPLNWDHEFREVHRLKGRFKTLATDGRSNPLPKSFFNRIQTFHAIYQKQKQNEETESWRWMITYHLKRMAQSIKDEEIRSFLNEVQTQVFTDQWQKEAKISSQYHYLTLLHLASRWADLEMRSN